MMKAKRQGEILDIISQKAVETQEQLLAELKLRGIAATQATISRDIKELHLVKELTGKGNHRYAPSGQKSPHGTTGRLQNFFQDGAVSFDQAKNLVVAKTMPGLAPALGSALDGMDVAGMVGTLAGDDTVLLIFRSDESAQRFCGTIRRTLG